MHIMIKYKNEYKMNHQYCDKKKSNSQCMFSINYRNFLISNETPIKLYFSKKNKMDIINNFNKEHVIVVTF